VHEYRENSYEINTKLTKRLLNGRDGIDRLDRRDGLDGMDVMKIEKNGCDKAYRGFQNSDQNILYLGNINGSIFIFQMDYFS